jgi:hypothetical protein
MHHINAKTKHNYQRNKQTGHPSGDAAGVGGIGDGTAPT